MSQQSPRWIDCTLFNGEPITILRLQYLWDRVDVFYICEGRYTHQGKPKEVLYLDKYKEWFEPYTSKVKFLVLEEPYTASVNYEHRHRNYPVEAILANETNAGPYIVFCADVDEIPDLRTLPSNEELFAISERDGPIHLEQRVLNPFRYYNRATSKHLIKCGWHFSYFQSVAEICRKLESFCHKEYNSPKYKDEAHILDCMTNGKDLFFRNKTFEQEDLSTFPPEFLEFGKRWLPGFSG